MVHRSRLTSHTQHKGVKWHDSHYEAFWAPKQVCNQLREPGGGGGVGGEGRASLGFSGSGAGVRGPLFGCGLNFPPAPKQGAPWVSYQLLPRCGAEGMGRRGAGSSNAVKGRTSKMESGSSLR